nr:PREDICTED: uncharacterized protein LOC106705559 [Latimeria chalumnae]|eukprot:XP_014350705.1 PREDICTED: uncharacterized protein LOC106705559 [Latimeria chalumnae]
MAQSQHFRAMREEEVGDLPQNLRLVRPWIFKDEMGRRSAAHLNQDQELPGSQEKYHPLWMSMENGGLPCGQDNVEANLDFSSTDNGMDLTKELDMNKDLTLSEPGTSLQKAEVPPVSQKPVWEGKEEEDKIVNVDASTSGGKEKGTAGTSKKKLYSEMLKNIDEKEGAYAEHRRKNVVRLRFFGEVIPTREYVAKNLLMDTMKFSPLQVFALIHISGSREYDISFQNGVYLENFWERYNNVKEDPAWKDFIAIVTANCVVLVVLLFDKKLHEPMYLLFWNMPINDLIGNCSLMPILISNLLSSTKEISYTGCIMQAFCIHTYGGVSLTILAAMAYDRYIAICNPLRILITCLSKRYAEAKKKAIQTCATHLLVFAIYEISSLFIIISHRIPQISENVRSIMQIAFLECTHSSEDELCKVS